MEDGAVCEKAKSHLLVVSAGMGSASSLEALFANTHNVREVFSTREALTACQQHTPDLVVVEVAQGKQEHLALCRLLKDDPIAIDLPILAIAELGADTTEKEAMAAGVVDCIGYPCHPPALQARIHAHLKLKYQTALLKASTGVDALTGCLNRQRFEEGLHAEWHRGRRRQTPLGLLVLSLNHQEALDDVTAQRCGQACRQVIKRHHDLIARYDTHLFVALLPETPQWAMQHLIALLRQALESVTSPREKPLSFALAMVCQVPQPDLEPMHLLEEAILQLNYSESEDRF